MIPNTWKGKIILFAGLDASGKTTAAKAICAATGMTYIKGVGRDEIFGKLAKKFGKTSLFLIEVLYVSWFPLRRALKNGSNVILDKYFFSVASHVPDVKTPLNKFLIRLTRSLIIRPDFIIYFRVSPEERKRRLESLPYNKFHQALIENPEWLLEREEAYANAVWFSGVDFHSIDTTNLPKEETAKKVRAMVDYFLERKAGENR